MRSTRPTLALVLVCLCPSVQLGCGGIRVSQAAITHNLRGTKELADAHLDDAEARFRLALELSPRFAEAHANLGLVLAQRGDYPGALDALGVAVNLAPDLAAAHVGLGNVHATEGHIDLAIADYERALAIQPEMPEPRRNLIRLLLLSERYVDARAHALRLVQLEPLREETVATLAYCELRTGRPAAAIARIDAARGVPRPAPGLDLVRALARVALGEIEEGLAALATLARDPVHGEAARLRRAALLVDLGRRQDARAACAEARRAGDDSEAIARIEASLDVRTRPGTPN